MKQKIDKINWYILAFVFAIELIMLNIVLKQCGISLYNNSYNWIRNILIIFSLDIVYILFFIDKTTKPRQTDNILDIYKIDANSKIIRNFIPLEILKLIFILISTSQITITAQTTKYINIIVLFTCITVFFYVLYATMAKKDNLRRKLKKLKNDIKKGTTSLNFILIDGKNTPSSFDIANKPNYKIAKNNLYINLLYDFPEIIKENPKAKELILNNTVAIIHEIKSNNSKEILEKYKKQEINNFHMYHVMAIKNHKNISDTAEYEYINSIKLCDLENDIQFTENLLTIELEDTVKKSTYNKALKSIKNGCDNKENYTKKLETIFKYNFNNRLKDNVSDIPQENFLFELYRNAYLNKSPYQSVLIFFNYITMVGRLVEYYLFAKYNLNFNENEIDSYKIGDNPSKWNSNIIINLYKQNNSVLYQNLREKQYKLNKDEEILLKVYLSYMLDTEIKGDTLTYDGMMDLLIAFRNKVEAHGIINDDNVYAVWNISKFFANMLNKMFKISDFRCEYSNNKAEVRVGYKGENTVSLGKYVIMYKNHICFIKDEEKGTYMDYFAGEIKPSLITKAKK